ncbi:ABC transporter substrate-binding protein [Litorihabitans aurantiacus]|uniref:Sugar ABC transporter substrate-binding protein n=1 Tax=Litorihabitans aurantiacus TaxID=1930061 RepID=A0AA38CU39_9MICO|nr:extracellular solute-binding protein [Litorihabitans aurantiacus]GMA33146.1 sugar ABC transporter substrate-binding protein [Litorihabitans aurantiacus]
MNPVRPRRLRATSLAAATLTGVLVLSACGGGSDSGDGVAEDGSVTLTFRTWIPSAEQWAPIVEAFEAENPDITIDFQGADGASNYLGELDNLILAGEVPDIYGIQTSSAFDDYAEYALDTSEYAADWIDGIKPELLESTTTEDGTVAALPILTAGSEFYLYNETLISELGLELPTSMDEVQAFSRAARDAGYTPFAMGAADAWHASDFFVWLSTQFGDGEDVYAAAAGDVPWDSDALVEAATTWQGLFSDGVFQDGATSTVTYPAARDDYFMARRALAMPTGSWHVSATLAGNSETPGSAVADDVLGMAPFPTLGENEAEPTTGVDYAMALSYELEGAKLDAAAKFAEFLAVGEGQQIWVDMMQGFPAAQDVTVELGDGETETALASVELVTQSLADATHPRKLASPTNDGLETDLGIVLQNIANGADPASELRTLG